MNKLKSIYYNPKYFDCHTIIAKDGSCFGMSIDAYGFNQYAGELGRDVFEGKHLGKKLDHIPSAIYQPIKERLQ